MAHLQWRVETYYTNELEFTVYIKFQKPQNVAIADGRVVDAKGIGNIQLSVKLKHQVQRKAALYSVL